MKKMTDVELQNFTGGSIIGLIGNFFRPPRIYLPGNPRKPKLAIM